MKKRVTVFIMLLFLLPLALLNAQEDGKKVLTYDDYHRWSRIGATSISDDGVWFSYSYRPLDGDDTLYFRNHDTGKVYEKPFCSNPSFSDDSQWATYLINLPQEKAEAERRNNRRVYRKAALINLGSGEVTVWEKAESISISPGSDLVLIKRVTGGSGERGSDLIVKSLADGWMINLGNVREYKLNSRGDLLAYTVDAADRLGNGLYLFDTGSRRITALDTDTLEYSRLTWDDEVFRSTERHRRGNRVAVLKGLNPGGVTQSENMLIIADNLNRSTTTTTIIKPEALEGFPEDYVVSDLSGMRFTTDGEGLLFGIKRQEERIRVSRDTVANVDVWHYADERIQSVQMRRANAERRSTDQAIIWLDRNRFVRLADETMPVVGMNRDGKRGIGRNPTPYIRDTDWGGSSSDIYFVDGLNGDRTLIVNELTRSMGSSPDGRYFLYFKDGHFHVYDGERGVTTNISEAAEVSFFNETTDYPYENPSYGFAGWEKGGRSVIVNHMFDLWELKLDGSGGMNLTGDYGTENSIRFRIMRTDNEPWVDLRSDLLLTAYGHWTKKSGYSRLRPGRAPETLIFDDASFSRATRAGSADRYYFTRQTFVDFPDLYISSGAFVDKVKVTDANPQQAEYAWGHSILVDYYNSRGDRLQATVSLPAGYETGKRYPTLVYFYDKMSQNHHRYSMPAYDDRPHLSAYASDGYLVVRPDINYYTGEPGWNAVDCLTAAVERVIELGYADPDRIGLQGHSWGGYQSSFVLTQTDIFACVVTGAPVTNLTSMYNILYKNSGTNNHGIMETGQVRMGKSLFEDFDNYAAQSPVFHVENINTPFLILHGTEDGAVDWMQGLEFYNAARRAGKQVILLSYPGENHHLAVRNNVKDFQLRMKEYFDHYLKGTPAPDWITRGVPFLEKIWEMGR